MWWFRACGTSLMRNNFKHYFYCLNKINKYHPLLDSWMIITLLKSCIHEFEPINNCKDVEGEGDRDELGIEVL